MLIARSIEYRDFLQVSYRRTVLASTVKKRTRARIETNAQLLLQWYPVHCTGLALALEGASYGTAIQKTLLYLPAKLQAHCESRSLEVTVNSSVNGLMSEDRRLIESGLAHNCV